MLGNDIIDKRRKRVITQEEKKVLRWLFLKTLTPIIAIIIISSLVLFFGLQFLMENVGFANYGLSPGVVTKSVSKFISTYMIIAIINIMMILFLSTAILYFILLNIVSPILRITNEIKTMQENNRFTKIEVRKSDKLFIPLIEQINKLLT